MPRTSAPPAPTPPPPDSEPTAAPPVTAVPPPAPPPVPVAARTVTCDLVAAPTGSDANPGTVSAPFATVEKLDASLAPGQVGCLRAGTYGTSTTETALAAPNVTITTFPGDAPATLEGFTDVPASGFGQTISNLRIDNDDVNDPWPALCAGGIGSAVVTFDLLVDASDVTIEHDEVFVDPSVPLTHRGGGIGVGFNDATTGDVIRFDRIHDVGFCPVEEHGVYLNKTTGVQVYGNWIYDIPAGTGVQVWDGPRNAHVYANVVDGASSCFDVGGSLPDTTGTLIEHNVCSNTVGVRPPYSAFCLAGPGCTGPAVGAPLFDFWPAGAGAGNAMSDNVLFCSPETNCGTSTDSASGVTVSGNVAEDPGFADANYRTSHDYRLAAGSPVAAWGLWDGSSG